MSNIQRPRKGEYNPYFRPYIDLVPEGDFNELLEQNTKAALSFFKRIPATKWDYRYDKDKWNIRQLLVHLTDAERVFAYRALVAARGDKKTKLHPMDDHLYVQQSGVERRTSDSILAEFKAVRGATEALFASITDQQSKFKADGVSAPISARALGYIIIGHMMHHMKVIKEWYL